MAKRVLWFLSLLVLSALHAIAAKVPIRLVTTDFPPFVLSSPDCLGVLCKLGAADAGAVDFGPCRNLSDISADLGASVELEILTVETEREILHALFQNRSDIGLFINDGVWPDNNATFEVVSILTRPVVALWYGARSIRPLDVAFETYFDTWPFCMALVIGCGVAGVIVCFLERPSEFWKGDNWGIPFVAEAMKGAWWAMITASTVGYGDKVAVKLEARIFGVFWAITGLVLVTMMTGDLIGTLGGLTAMTAMQWLAVEKLKLGVRRYTSSEVAAFNHALEHVPYSSYDTLCRGLNNGEVDAAFMDLHRGLGCFTAVPGIEVAEVPEFREQYNMMYNVQTVSRHAAMQEFVRYLIHMGEYPNLVKAAIPPAPPVTIKAFPLSFSPFQRFASSLVLLSLALAVSILFCGCGLAARRFLPNKATPIPKSR